MSAAPLQQEPNDFEHLLSRVRELAVLPHVVYRVLEVSGSSDTSTAEVERAIVVDPGFSSRLLTVVNSAYYALPRKITSIREAVLFLGLKTIRQIAMTVGIYDMFVGKTDKESLRRRAWWRHSVDTAVCSRWLARKIGRVSPDDAYTCGLLHLIGKTLLDRFGGHSYERVEELVAEGKSVRDAERETYGCDHVEIAVAAAKKWGFPEPLLEGLLYDQPVEPTHQYAANRACVALASLIADSALMGAKEDTSQPGLPEWALKALGVDPELQLELMEGGKAAIADAASMQL